MLSTIRSQGALHWLGRQLFNRDDPGAFFDPLLAVLNPMWVRGFVPARLLDVIDETADTRTFRLRPSARWQGFRAGQHVNVIVDVDGVRQHRTFTISSAPSQWRTDGTLTLTVKRHPGGHVTHWMHDHLRPGTILGISQAFGEFDLPPSGQPKPLLYIMGGSGVTPALSHLVSLAERDYRAPVTLLYYVRTQADVIGAETLYALAARWPALSLHVFATEEQGEAALLNEQHLDAVPGFAARDAYLCGPPGLMDRANALLARYGVQEEQIRCTFFSAPTAVAADTPLGGAVTFARSDIHVDSDGDAPLLEIAEAAELNPAYGCRMGICHQCSCRKTEGTVVNRLTGKASGPGEETIQLCISVPQGPVTVDL
ncbi:ferredoxin reductase [Marinobacter bohaiensis]|uniref:ferredoxin reductase n=1 Tax=Marinobacter bohaiensis TaxID=2201898 RepID=UPI000DAC735A|nr:ferredoxin reductase [Marinobacter bohaiensis]